VRSGGRLRVNDAVQSVQSAAKSGVAQNRVANSSATRRDRAKDALGKRGEELAARHLGSAGSDLLARNWRCPAGEIDIVATDGDVLVVVEVKTRTSTLFGTPADAITRRKAGKLGELALTWLSEHPGAGRAVRFDVVGVLLPPGGEARLEHLRGVL
jgi:putative endonuclease